MVIEIKMSINWLKNKTKAGEAMSLRMWENYPEYITDG